MKLTNDQREGLHSALKQMCAVRADVNKLTFRAFGQALDQITTSTAGVDDLLYAVVSDAEIRQSGVGNLIDAAIGVLEEAPGAQPLPAAHPLKHLRSELVDVIFEEREDPLAASWLLGDRVLIDRQDLRAKVSALGQAARGMHILVVQGKRGSGRSHSLQLIRYLKERLGNFEFFKVDLADLADLNDDRDLRPEDLGQEIADRMGLGQVPERQTEKDAKWANRFCSWLTDKVKAKVKDTGKPYWIVLDSFDKKLLPQGIYDLVGAIADRIETDLDELRLVLLSYDQGKLPAQVQGGMEVEDIASQIGPNELLEFFDRLYKERMQRRNVPFSPDDLASSVQTVLQAVDPNSEQYLLELHKKVVEVAKPIRAGSAGGVP